MTNMAVIYKDAFGDNKWMEVEGSDSSMTRGEVVALFVKQVKATIYRVVDVFSMAEVDLTNEIVNEVIKEENEAKL